MTEPSDDKPHSDDDARRVINESLRVSEHSAPVGVPVFTCVIHVLDRAGGVTARVANLPDLNCEAATERDALSQLVTRFKQSIRGMAEEKAEIPWIEPPLAAADEERTRWIPVHL